MLSSNDVVIISGVRTPIGTFQGALSDLSATQLGAFRQSQAVGAADWKLCGDPDLQPAPGKHLNM